MNALCLDTGFLIAIEAADDQHHEAALNHWRSLLPLLPPITTTSYVFDEVVAFFNSRNRHNKAVEIGTLLLGSPSIEFVHVDESLFKEAGNTSNNTKTNPTHSPIASRL